MQIPPWLMGEHLTEVAMDPLNTGATGTLTVAGGGGTILAQTSSIQLEKIVESRDVRAVHRMQLNNVPTGKGFRLRCSILIRSDIANAQALMFTYDRFRMIFTRGKERYVGYFLAGGFTDGVTDHAGNELEMTFEPIDPNFDDSGTAQVTRTTV